MLVICKCEEFYIFKAFFCIAEKCHLPDHATASFDMSQQQMDVTVFGAAGSSSLSIENTLMSMGEIDLHSAGSNGNSSSDIGIGIGRARSPGNLSQDSCHMDEAEAKGKLDVVVRRAEVLQRTNSAQEAGMPCYKMESKPRGLALIIEIEEYVNDVQEPRLGSKVGGIFKEALFLILIEIFQIV